ncbi:hypothetical protein, partial [Chitinilyticum litopenaei]|uniref:hypothetical protein n=1 Tax=Chitinilyticum litopenaei TaxID=1121276 RepID=UPI001B7FB636
QRAALSARSEDEQNPLPSQEKCRSGLTERHCLGGLVFPGARDNSGCALKHVPRLILPLRGNMRVSAAFRAERTIDPAFRRLSFRRSELAREALLIASKLAPTGENIRGPDQ